MVKPPNSKVNFADSFGFLPEINLIVAPPASHNTCLPNMENWLPHTPSNNYSPVLSAKQRTKANGTP